MGFPDIIFSFYVHIYKLVSFVRFATTIWLMCTNAQLYRQLSLLINVHYCTALTTLTTYISCYSGTLAEPVYFFFFWGGVGWNISPAFTNLYISTTKPDTAFTCVRQREWNNLASSPHNIVVLSPELQWCLFPWSWRDGRRHQFLLTAKWDRGTIFNNTQPYPTEDSVM